MCSENKKGTTHFFFFKELMYTEETTLVAVFLCPGVFDLVAIKSKRHRTENTSQSFHCTFYFVRKFANTDKNVESNRK